MHRDGRAVATFLREQRIDVGFYRPDLVRVDVHAFNTHEEIDRLIESLRPSRATRKTIRFERRARKPRATVRPNREPTPRQLDDPVWELTLASSES